MRGDVAEARADMKRLLLLGGGHAHVHVLADLARAPLPGWTVRLVSPWPRQIYSGLLPGWLAGDEPIEACAIDLAALCRRAGVDFAVTAGTGLDLDRRLVSAADGSVHGWDRLSIDTGSVAATTLPGVAEHALSIRPIERFIAAWPVLAERIRTAGSPFHLCVLGAGAGGLELVLAIGQRAGREGWSGLRLSLVGHEALPLPGAPMAARRQALALLQRRGITWRGSSRALAVEPDHLRMDAAAPIPFDACLVATGAAAPGWPAASGLATDAQGCIRVDRRLCSVSHPDVSAAGDIAALADARPKSGVYAVRAGPVLAANLRAACLGLPLQDWTPQARALYLINTGDRRAIATWGRWAWPWPSRWIWRWKARIDHGFMRRCSSAGPQG